MRQVCMSGLSVDDAFRAAMQGAPPKATATKKYKAKRKSKQWNNLRALVATTHRLLVCEVHNS
jgi:hypothetical protein